VSDTGAERQCAVVTHTITVLVISYVLRWNVCGLTWEEGERGKGGEKAGRAVSVYRM